MDKDTEIFKGKSFSDIAKDLYGASKKKESQINLLISELNLEVGVKNDDQLAKLLAVVQRLIGNNSHGDSDFGISEDEKKQLLEELSALETSNAEIDVKLEGVENGRIHNSTE
jgi:hypothetical protein